MFDFTYDLPTKIYFGKDQLKRLPEEIQKKGRHLLLIYGEGSIKKTGLYDKIIQQLTSAHLTITELPDIKPNPRISRVREGIQLCKDNNIDYILSVGGGSCLDTAKVIAAGVYYPDDPWTLFFDNNERHITKALPIGCLLTIPATGSETNRNAVITNQETQEKLAVHSDLLRPTFSILDPTITMTLPIHQTACGIVDTMSHVFEQYFSTNNDAFLEDRLAESILMTCIHYGPKVLKDPDDYETRANLMWASTLALSFLLSCGKKTDWATHGIEHGLSALTDVTHADGLAILTPAWMRHVLTKDTSYKFAEYARNVWRITGDDEMVISRQAIKKTEEFFRCLDMPYRLRDIGVDQDILGDIADKVVSSGRMGNFKRLTREDVMEILSDCY